MDVLPNVDILYDVDVLLDVDILLLVDVNNDHEMMFKRDDKRNYNVKSNENDLQ